MKSKTEKEIEMKSETMVNQKCACGHKAEDHAKKGTGECVDCFTPEAGTTDCKMFRAPKETGMVAAQVYHVKEVETLDISLLSKIAWGEVAIDFPKNYELVADLKIEAEATAVPYGVLEEAFKLTNNIHESWVENVEGAVLRDPIAYGGPGRRSTSVGDVVTVAGVAYICAPMGWQQVVSADQKLVRGVL